MWSPKKTESGQSLNSYPATLCIFLNCQMGFLFLITLKLRLAQGLISEVKDEKKIYVINVTFKNPLKSS